MDSWQPEYRGLHLASGHGGNAFEWANKPEERDVAEALNHKRVKRVLEPKNIMDPGNIFSA